MHFRNIIRTSAAALAFAAMLTTSHNAAASSAGTFHNAGITSLKAAEGTPAIVLDNKSFTKARGRVGEKVAVGTVHVSASGLPGGVVIVPSSSVEGIFTTDVAQLPQGDSETDITIYYEAVKIGKDEGKLYFMAGGSYYEEIKVGGLAIDPAMPPTLTAEPLVINDFKAEVSTADEKTVSVSLSGFPSPVDVKVTQAQPGFSVNTGMLYHTVAQHSLKVTFFPKKSGSYEAVITLSNEFIDPVEIKVYGTATGGDEEPEKEGDELPLSYDNPLTLLDEHFDNVGHNKPLSLEGWKNIAAIGNRAWWGYTFPDYDEDNAGMNVAKVTAYDSKMEAGLDQEMQMLLVTPPLDYKNAASKMFTFRVMGKFLVENMTEELMLCTLSEEDGGLMAYPVEGVQIPTLPDESGEWRLFHIDLSDKDLPDVFHMGFLFNGMRGPDHSTTYFIDDVSFGRTDIPVIRTDREEVYMDAVDGASVTSPDVIVTTENLKKGVGITLEGKYKDDFSLSSSVLPAEGGKFNVTYNGSYADGYYGIYAKLSSEGAAPKYVAFFASIVSGIQSVEVSAADRVEIIGIGGTVVARTSGTSVVETLSSLPSGTYVLKISGTSGSRTIKVSR